jgi:hypothetical protein
MKITVRIDGVRVNSFYVDVDASADLVLDLTSATYKLTCENDSLILSSEMKSTDKESQE